MKKSLLIKSSGLYCINFDYIDDVSKHYSNGSYKVLLYNKDFEDPVFVLYYKESYRMETAYTNIKSIIESKKPGKVIRVNFGRDNLPKD
jgi:fibronectin type 3 domain-containing protein